MNPAVAVTLVVGGDETPGPVGGLAYRGTERIALDHRFASPDGTWELQLARRVDARPPRVALGFTLRCSTDAVLRDVELAFAFPVDDPDDWVLNAPGNPCRPDLPVAALAEPVGLFTAGDTLGSPGIVALSRRSAPETAVLWPLCRTEVGELDVSLRDGSVMVCLRTGLGARLRGGDELVWGSVQLDTIDEPWERVRAALPDWSRGLGLKAPADAPTWLRRAHIYEAHVGFSVFAGGHRHERYPALAELRADLPRIRALGFDALQLMPRHPYPSYNVHDYADVTTTYGGEAELRALVADSHRLGMRVLLDVIMHGVVDAEVVDETVAAVRSGPYAERLGDGTIDFLSRSAEDVAWSRHIVEYAPHWRAGARARHPLPDAHPEWFMRDSAGRITRRYTKAFDIAHPGWQRYFLDACADLVARLDVDGFRVDAPTYNDFASWAPERAGRASDGALASLGLLAELRRRLPGLAVYTEPTGALFRAVADATYNYDEHWLIESLLGEPHPERERRLIRDARELAAWLRDRDAALPPGSTVVHHIDSHDSIWWRLTGAQWKRERFGRAATVALLVTFSLGGGAFLTFMGGEEGIEEELERALALRRRLPELAEATADYDGSSDQVLVLRRAASLVAVNLTPAPAELSLPGGRLHDAWNDEAVDATRLAFAPFQPRVLHQPAPSTR
jgi:Alpha amylase, catalytic domain/Domain of unknown function (DUF3459)